MIVVDVNCRSPPPWEASTGREATPIITDHDDTVHLVNPGSSPRRVEVSVLREGRDRRPKNNGSEHYYQ